MHSRRWRDGERRIQPGGLIDRANVQGQEGAALLRRVPCTAGLGASSAVTSFGMQLQPKRTDDFKNGVEAWATITGERFVKTFAR